MGGIRKGWYAREEVQKVTLDWMKSNCKITKKEKELLQIIHDRKLVSRNHLEILSPSLRKLGNNRTRLTNRTIRSLFEKMCIDKMHEKQELGRGNTPCIVALDKGGSLLLGVPHKPRIAHKIQRVKDKCYIYRKLPANYRHINGVNQLEVDTILFCDDSGHEIIRWELENPQELYYGQDNVILIPDVGLELKLNGDPSEGFKTLYAFLEYDTGSEGIRYKEPPVIRDKIIKYKKYKMSNIWEKEYPYFPLLLFITEDEKRIDFFNKKCKEIGVKGIGVYYKNYIDVLKKIAMII